MEATTNGCALLLPNNTLISFFRLTKVFDIVITTENHFGQVTATNIVKGNYQKSKTLTL
jgi:hypothetical protein